MTLFIVYSHIEWDEYDSDSDIQVFDSKEKADAFINWSKKVKPEWSTSLYERELR